MLKTELFAQKEIYSNAFRLTNEAMSYIMPQMLSKNNTIQSNQKRILNMRSDYIRNPEKEKSRSLLIEYLNDFQFKIFELNKELSSLDKKFYDTEKIIQYIGTILNNIKSIIVSPTLTEIQIYSIADLILEFGILCSSFRSYYLTLENLIEEFSIKEEFIYISFYKNDNEDLNYSEFLLVAEFMNSCIEFIFGEYSDKVHIHLDTGSNNQWKIELTKLMKGEIKMIDSVKDNIKAFFNGLIDKNKNESAILIKNSKSAQDLIRQSINNEMELLDKIVEKAKIKDQMYYENELKNIYDKYSRFSEKNLQMSIDSLYKKSSSTLEIERTVMKQIAETSNINSIE